MTTPDRPMHKDTSDFDCPGCKTVTITEKEYNALKSLSTRHTELLERVKRMEQIISVSENALRASQKHNVGRPWKLVNEAIKQIEALKGTPND